VESGKSNVHFISSLMEAGVEFIAVDFPQANRWTAPILSAVAEHEAAMISSRNRGGPGRSEGARWPYG
jgi:hypothetical protein